MAPTPSHEADLVAELVRIGSRMAAIEARERVQTDLAFSDWYLVVGQGAQIPQAALPLIFQAAQSQPGWADPAAVNLSDPLAMQLLELALSISGD